MNNSKNLVLAGTFDHLHKGHEEFISQSLNQVNTAYCGLTTKQINQNKAFNQSLESYSKRYQTLKTFIQNRFPKKQIKIFPLADSFGLSILKSNLHIISVTQENYYQAIKINQLRKKAKLSPLSIFKQKLVLASDQKKISSTRIRAGQINRGGLVYNQFIPNQKTFYLPSKHRFHFQKPMGKILAGATASISWAGIKALKNINKNKYPLLIAVGDIAIQTLLNQNLVLDLAVFDGLCQRKPVNLNFHHRLKQNARFYYQIKNLPGTISSQSLKLLKTITPKLAADPQTTIIKVNGEEDLLTLPLILLTPLKTLLFYGQPGIGLVMIRVTEKIKAKALALLSKLNSFSS